MDLFEFIKNTAECSIEIQKSDFVCNTCHMVFVKKRKRNHSSSAIQEPDDSDILHLSTINRGTAGHSCCCFGCGSSATLARVPQKIINKLLIDFNFYIAPFSRCCASHLQEGDWASYIQRSPKNDFNNKQVEDMFLNLKSQILDLKNQLNQAKKMKNVLDFEQYEDIRDSLFESWTDFTKVQYEAILSAINIRSCMRPKTSLALYLSKLHTGEKNERLAVTLGLARATAEEWMEAARSAIRRDFVPKYLDSCWTRNKIIENNSAMACALFSGGQNNRAITIWDGTYRDIQRSANYGFQRKSYSGHKKKPLYKPLLGICPNGKIVAVLGPFTANTSDSKLLEHSLKT